ncbi:MAG: hypothetical protein PHI93_08455 [Kiritimatiellae bacterium]|nr:hypothetical protein [Kiritimatiellia bacterium]
MKMLMTICPEHRREEICKLISQSGIHTYSVIPNVLGKGTTGKHLGTHTWPGKSDLVFTVVPTAEIEKLIAALKNYHDSLYESEGLRVFALPVEAIF